MRRCCGRDIFFHLLNLLSLSQLHLLSFQGWDRRWGREIKAQMVSSLLVLPVVFCWFTVSAFNQHDYGRCQKPGTSDQDFGKLPLRPSCTARVLLPQSLPLAELSLSLKVPCVCYTVHWKPAHPVLLNCGRECLTSDFRTPSRQCQTAFCFQTCQYDYQAPFPSCLPLKLSFLLSSLTLFQLDDRSKMDSHKPLAGE